MQSHSGCFATVELIVTMTLTIQRLLQSAAGYESEKTTENCRHFRVWELRHVQNRLHRLQLGKLSENECSQLHWADYEFQSQTSIPSSSIINEIEISSFCYVYIFRSIFLSLPAAAVTGRGSEKKKANFQFQSRPDTESIWCEIRSESSGEMFSFFLLIDPAPTLWERFFVLNSNIFPANFRMNFIPKHRPAPRVFIAEYRPRDASN